MSWLQFRSLSACWINRKDSCNAREHLGNLTSRMLTTFTTAVLRKRAISALLCNLNLEVWPYCLVLTKFRHVPLYSSEVGRTTNITASIIVVFQALQASDLNLVLFACETTDPRMIFSVKPCPLTQPTLLSLIQQLSCDLANKTEHKLKYVLQKKFFFVFKLSNGNAFVSGAGGLRFIFRDSQIGHSVANGSPPLQYFFERTIRNDADIGPANSLHTSA